MWDFTSADAARLAALAVELRLDGATVAALLCRLAAEEDATVDDELTLADDGTVDEDAEREKRLQRIHEDMARKMEEKARAESREGLQALAKRCVETNHWFGWS